MRTSPAQLAADVWSDEYVPGPVLKGRLGGHVFKVFRRWFPGPADPRLKQVSNFTRLGFNITRYVGDVKNIAVMDGANFNGDPPEWWEKSVNDSKLESACSKRGALVPGIGSCAMVIRYDANHPKEPWVRTLLPNQFWWESLPSDNEQPVTFGEYYPDRVVVRSMVAGPHWVEAPDRNAYEQWRKSGRGRVRVIAMGDDYPLLGDDGRALLGAVPFKDPRLDGIAPINNLPIVTVQDVALRTWASYPSDIRGWPALAAGSSGGEDQAPAADENLFADPALILAIQNATEMQVLPSAVKDSQGRIKMLNEQLALILKQYDRRLVLDTGVGETSRGDVEITWEAAEEEAAFNETVAAYKDGDTEVQANRLAVRNWLVRMGVLQGPEVPVDGHSHAYTWRESDASKRRRAEASTALYDRGLLDGARLTLSLRGQRLTPENIEKVIQEFEAEETGILALRGRFERPETPTPPDMP